MMRERKKLFGFSLVELMAVVAVMSILVALALPRFQTFIARGRQAEAMHNLSNIDSLQKSFRLRWQGLGDDDRWHSGLNMGEGSASGTCDPTGSGGQNTLGFRVDDCSKLRYTYTTGGATSLARNDGHDRTKRIYPNCSSGSGDMWRIRHLTGGNKKLDNPTDIIEECAN